MAIAFAQGTRLLFCGNNAPVGWTKVADYTDHMLRVLGSGSPASGGQTGNPFTGALSNPSTFPASVTVTSTASGATTLTNSTYVAHAHSYERNWSGVPVKSAPTSPNLPGYSAVRNFPNVTQIIANTGVTGTGGSHSHPTGTVAFPATIQSKTVVRYIDVIMATRD